MGAILAQMIDWLSLCPQICQVSFLLPKQYDIVLTGIHTFHLGSHLGCHLGRRIACDETLTVFVSPRMLFVGLSIKTIFVSTPSLHLFTIYWQIYNNLYYGSHFGRHLANVKILRSIMHMHAFLLFNSTGRQFSLPHCQMNLCHLGANI